VQFELIFKKSSIANICITCDGRLKRIKEVAIKRIETLGGVMLELIDFNLLVVISPTFLVFLQCETT
jgi:hypothetical protein